MTDRLPSNPLRDPDRPHVLGRSHTSTIHYWRDTPYLGEREGSRVYWYSYCGVSVYTKPTPLERHGADVEGERCPHCKCCPAVRRADPEDQTMGFSTWAAVEAEHEARRTAARKTRTRTKRDPRARKKKTSEEWELDLVYGDAD